MEERTLGQSGEHVLPRSLCSVALHELGTRRMQALSVPTSELRKGEAQEGLIQTPYVSRGSSSSALWKAITAPPKSPLQRARQTPRDTWACAERGASSAARRR